MTDEQEAELHEELKWAKIEAEQAHMMVDALEGRVKRLREALEKIRAEKFSSRTKEAKFWKMQDIARDALEGK